MRLTLLFPICLIPLLALPAAQAAETPRAGWYETRTRFSNDGQRWQDAPRAGDEDAGFCVLGLKEQELEQIYRASFERDGCTVQQLRIGGGSGQGVAVCQANGHPAHLQVRGSYGPDRFETEADSRGTLVIEQNRALPFRLLARSSGQRVRDCSAAEQAQSREQLQAR